MRFDRIYLNGTEILFPTKDLEYTVEFRFTEIIINYPKFITTFSESFVLRNNNMVIYRWDKQPYYEENKQALFPYRLIFLRLKGV